MSELMRLGSKLVITFTILVLLLSPSLTQSFAKVTEKITENPPGSGKFKKSFGVSPGDCDRQPDGKVLHTQRHANGVYAIKCWGNSIVITFTDNAGNEVFLGKCQYPNGHNFIYKKYTMIGGNSYLNFTGFASLDAPANQVPGTNYTNLPDVEYGFDLDKNDFMSKNTTHWFFKTNTGFRVGTTLNTTGGNQEGHGLPPSTPGGLKFPRTLQMASAQDFTNIGSFALAGDEFERFSNDFETTEDVGLRGPYDYQSEPEATSATNAYLALVAIVVIIAAGIYISLVFGRKRQHI